MNVEALEWMSLNNNMTLRSIQWIDSVRNICILYIYFL